MAAKKWYADISISTTVAVSLPGFKKYTFVYSLSVILYIALHVYCSNKN